MNKDKWVQLASANDDEMRAMSDKAEIFTPELEDYKPDISLFVDRALELQKLLGSAHDVFAELTYVIEPLARAVDSIEEKKGSGSPLKGVSREKVISVCNKHGLRTLDQLLVVLDRIQQAQKGTLTSA